MKHSFSAAEQAQVNALNVEELARAAALTPGDFACDRGWLARFALLVAAAERRACIAAAEAEAVDADATGSESDAAYNQALRDACDAIARRVPTPASGADAAKTRSARRP